MPIFHLEASTVESFPLFCPKDSIAAISNSQGLGCIEASLRAGGAEHAVLHLLYARFWHKVLYDIGLVSRKEPFQSLVSQGMILGEVGHEETE